MQLIFRPVFFLLSWISAREAVREDGPILRRINGYINRNEKGA